MTFYNTSNMQREVSRRNVRGGRWERIPVMEMLVSLAMLCVPILSHHQLAALACSGGQHSLPADSRALAGYPCNGSTARSLLYLARNLPPVLWDVFQLEGKDAWIMVGFPFLLFRLASSAFLPQLFHRKVVAPAAMYLTRATPFTFHVLQGSRFRPSPFGLRILFRNLPAYDIGFFFSLLGIWRVNAAVEVLYCCFTIAEVAVLCYWYRDIVPGGVYLPLQIAMRLLVCFVNLYTARAVQQQQLYGRSGPSGSSASSGNAAAPSSGKPTTRESGGGGVGELVPPSLHGGGRSGGSGTVRWPRAPACGSASVSVPTSVPTKRRLSDAATGVTERPPGGDSPVIVREPPAPPIVTIRTAAAAGTPAVAAEATTPQLPLVQPRLYTPFFERYALGVKVPWAEPEQLSPNFRKRLRQLVERDELQPGSWRLAGAFVRRGCVELVLLLLRRARPGPAAAPNPPPDVPLEASELVRALGLPPGPEPLSTQVKSGAGGNSAAAHGGGNDGSTGRGAGGAGGGVAGPSTSSFPRRQDRRPVGMWVLGGVGSGGDESPAAPRVLSAWPRVVLLPSSSVPVATPPPPGGNASTSPTRFPATLRVVMAWGRGNVSPGGSGGSGPSAAAPPARQEGAQHDEGQTEEEDAGPSAPSSAGRQAEAAPPERPPGAPGVQVLVRACNEYLPTDITSSNAVPGSGDLPSYKYDIELRDPPPRPGVLLVELSGGPAGAEGSGGGGGGHAAEHCQRVSIPLLATYDPGVASELTGAVAEWPPGARRQLDGLLYDMGVWMAAEAAGEGGEVGHLLHDQLGCHLLQYAEAAGLEHTAALLRTRGGSGGAGRRSTYYVAESPVTTPAAAAPAVGATGSASAATTDVSSKGEQHPGSAAAPSSAGGEGSGSRTLHLSSSSPGGPAMTVVEQWNVGMAGTLHVLETALFVASLMRNYRAGVPPLSSVNVILIICMGVSTVVLLARLVMPYNAWVRLAVHARVPRYLGYIVSKALLVAGVAPMPDGMVPYTAGVGMLLYEGVILPGCCLLDLRTAALFAILKLLANAGMMVRARAATDVAAALMVSARTEVFAILTTAACHVYLQRRTRVRGVASMEREAEGAAAARRSGGVSDGGGAGDGGGGK